MDGVGEFIYSAPIAQFNPLRLPVAATSPGFCEASLWGGGGVERSETEGVKYRRYN